MVGEPGLEKLRLLVIVHSQAGRREREREKEVRSMLSSLFFSAKSSSLFSNSVCVFQVPNFILKFIGRCVPRKVMPPRKF